MIVSCIRYRVPCLLYCMPTIAYIGLGSNMGDKKTNCRRALELLEAGCRVLKVSSFYRTEPVGYKDQDEFINAVAEVETERPPRELLRLCNEIEDALGRSREVRWGPRTIDLDILLYGDSIVHEHGPDLTIPHPLLAERRFFLEPLAEIAPRARHPLLGKTAAAMLDELGNQHRVVKSEP